MSKKIVVLTGSPRKDGNSMAMADAFIETVKAKGHVVTRFDAAEKHVEGCRACNNCYKNDKACCVDDDFNELAPAIEAADAVVFAMPLYWYSFPSKIKAAIDKMYSLLVAEKKMAGKESGLIVCCEEDNIAAMDGIVKSYECCMSYLEWKSAGTVLITGVGEPGDVNKTDGIAQAKALAEKF